MASHLATHLKRGLLHHRLLIVIHSLLGVLRVYRGIGLDM